MGKGTNEQVAEQMDKYRNRWMGKGIYGQVQEKERYVQEHIDRYWNIYIGTGTKDMYRNLWIGIGTNGWDQEQMDW